MKRYVIDTEGDTHENPLGNWVKYEDVEKIIGFHCSREDCCGIQG
jgi:hypothetical protein